MRLFTAFPLPHKTCRRVIPHAQQRAARHALERIAMVNQTRLRIRIRAKRRFFTAWNQASRALGSTFQNHFNPIATRAPRFRASPFFSVLPFHPIASLSSYRKSLLPIQAFLLSTEGKNKTDTVAVRISRAWRCTVFPTFPFERAKPSRLRYSRRPMRFGLSPFSPALSLFPIHSIPQSKKRRKYGAFV